MKIIEHFWHQVLPRHRRKSPSPCWWIKNFTESTTYCYGCWESNSPESTMKGSRNFMESLSEIYRLLETYVYVNIDIYIYILQIYTIMNFWSSGISDFRSDFHWFPTTKPLVKSLNSCRTEALSLSRFNIEEPKRKFQVTNKWQSRNKTWCTNIPPEIDAEDLTPQY